MKLEREFVHVYQSEGEGNALKGRLFEDLVDLRGDNCMVSEHAGTITIACQSLWALGELAEICTDIDPESDNHRFFSGLRAALVKFVG
ncbi:MAG: hypothetical protein JRE40_11230 [Deltaproteobacteria bacterium]|nr:hypothetical protein [Deltaproteobacteria bacterium]